VPTGKHLQHWSYSCIAALKQNEEVINQVRGFIVQRSIIFRGGGDDQFDRFLTKFLLASGWSSIE
jgi:hypothetical protein